MNGLPQLRTNWIPDIGSSFLRAEQIQQTRMQNQLAQQQMAERPEERNWLMEQRGAQRAGWGRAEAVEERAKVGFGVQKEASAISNALKGATTEQQQQIYKASGGSGQFEAIGPNVKFMTPDGITFEAPQKVMGELSQQLQQDPTWLTNPEKARHTFAWFSAKGGSITQAKPTAYKPTTREQMLADEEAKAKLRAKAAKPSEQISQIKLEAIRRMAKGQDTPEDRRILGKEGYWITKAFETLRAEMTDPRNRNKTSDYWAKEAVRVAKYMEQAAGTKGGVEPTPGGKAYDFIPGKGLVAR